MISRQRNILAFAIALFLALFVTTTTFAQQGPSGVPRLPQGAKLMTPDELMQQLNNVGISKTNATITDAQAAGFSIGPTTSSALITFVSEGSTVVGGFSLIASNGLTLQPGSFVFANIANPGQPPLFQWGMYFSYSVSPGGLWYPLENERKEKYTEIAGMANYQVSVYQPGVGLQTFSLAKTIKKYETGLATPHFIVDGYDAGSNQLVLLGNFPGGKPSVVLKDSDSYNTFHVDPIAVENYGFALVVNVSRDLNIGSLPTADYITGVTTTDGQADSFMLRVGARNSSPVGMGGPNPSTPPVAKPGATDKASPPSSSTAVVPLPMMIINLPRDWDSNKDKDEAKKQEEDKQKKEKAEKVIPPRPQQ